MTDNDVLKVRAALSAQNLKLNKDGVFSSRDLSKATTILTTLGFELNEYYEADKHYRARQAQLREVEQGPEPNSISTGFERKEFVHPTLDVAHGWGSGDKLWLGDRINFERNPVDGSLIMLIKTHEHRYTAIPLANSKSAMRTILATTLSHSEANHPESFSNLYDELMYGIDKVFETGIKKFRNKDLKNPEEMADYIVKYLPLSMLKHYKIGMVTESREIEDTHGNKRVVTVPHAMYFTNSGTRVDLLDLLADHADALASNKNLIFNEPLKIYSNDPNESSLKYINLDELPEDKPHPTWDYYFNRFSPEEAKVLRAFIWSIFDASNTGRQLLYIYDKDGFSGKSALLNAISSCLDEDMVASLQKDSMSNQFGLAKVWDKRLVTIPDNKNPNLIRSEKMHMILGGDIAEIEMKGRNSFTARLQAKVIACGNTALRIDPSASHERTRVIILTPHVNEEILKQIAVCDKDGNVIRVHGRPQLIGDNSFEQRLKDEFRAMLTDAKKDYEELCPTRSSLILPESILQNIDASSDDTLDIMDNIVEENFEIGEGYWMTPSDLRSEFILALSDDLAKILDYDSFVAHISKKYGVVKQYYKDAHKTLGTKNPVYVNIKAKSRKLG